MSSSSDLVGNWPGGKLVPNEVLYEYDGPTIFVSTIGLTEYLVYKANETDEYEQFLAVPIRHDELELLKRGRISVRGALIARAEVWLIQTDYSREVHQVKQLGWESLAHWLPRPAVGLLPNGGRVPDSFPQAEALLAFKFEGPALSPGSIRLSTLKNYLNQISYVVREVLLPDALSKGRNNRFFDVQMGAPVLASLMLTIKAPEIDKQGLANFNPTKTLSADRLHQEALMKSKDLWEALEESTDAIEKKAPDFRSTQRHREILQILSGILPNTDNDLDRLEVSYGGQNLNKILTIDKNVGDQIQKAIADVAPSQEVVGTIFEINGESGTFIIKSDLGRQTTCKPSPEILQQMEKNGDLQRGTKLRVQGPFWERTRRDYIYFDTYPDFFPKP